MERLDWRSKLVWLPLQTPGLAAAVGLPQAELDAAAWAVTPAGSRHRGAAAIAAGLGELLPGGLPLFLVLYGLPGVRPLSDWGYRWVARNRSRFPAGPSYIATHGTFPPLTAEIGQQLTKRLGGGRLGG